MNPRLKRSTRALYEDLLRMWIDPYLGNLRLSDLSPAKVREWHAEISNQTGKTRVAQAYRLLRAIMNTGVADGALVSNPCRIDGAGASKARPVQLLPIPVIEETEAHLPPRYRSLLQVLVWSGMRFGEAAELRRKHIDLGTRAVTIERRLYRIPTTGQYSAAALQLQGSGWSVLAWESMGQRLVISQFYDHQANMPAGIVPLLMPDMWEHAYYLDYQATKADYVTAWWNIVNWPDVAHRLQVARTQGAGLVL